MRHAEHAVDHKSVWKTRMKHSNDEFSLISRFFSDVGSVGGPFSDESLVALGIGDDCAVLRSVPDYDTCLSIDTLVCGVHFPENIAPDKLGYRCLAVSLSDLAAMGAHPTVFTLAITLPDNNAKWLEGFSQGLSRIASEYGIRLVGGDTTRGPLTLSLQVHGLVPSGTAIKRSGARPGDLICVTGVLGYAGAALDYLHVDDASVLLKDNIQHFLSRYYYPQPRISTGIALRGLASAAIDISDGLLADYNHIAEASGVGGVFYEKDIPLSNALSVEVGDKALSLALSAGDDYELCFCIPESQTKHLRDNTLFNDVLVIGKVSEAQGMIMIDGDGNEKNLSPKGYQHF